MAAQGSAGLQLSWQEPGRLWVSSATFRESDSYIVRNLKTGGQYGPNPMRQGSNLYSTSFGDQNGHELHRGAREQGGTFEVMIMRTGEAWTIIFPGSGGAPALAPAPGPAAPQDGIVGLARDIGAFLGSETFSDVRIVLDTCTLPAHSIILAARSKFFAAMLQCPMKEGLSREVILKDLAEPVVRDVLGFMYKGTLNLDSSYDVSKIIVVLQAAHRFDVPELVNQCSDALSNSIETETVAELLQLADTFACKNLHLKCMAYIKKNISEVQTTDGYASLAHKCPKLMMGIVAVLCRPPSKEWQRQDHCKRRRPSNTFDD